MANNDDNLGFGLPPKESQYDVYRDTPVRVFTGNHSYYGVVSKIGEGYLLLCPCVVHEELPVTLKGKREVTAILRKDIPRTLSLSSIEAVDPLSEGFLEKLVKRINELSSKKKTKK